MGASHSEPQNDVDLTALPSALGRSAKAIVVASVIVGALTYGGLSLVPPRYTSVTQVSVGARGADNNGNAALQVDREAIRSRVQELRSPDLARKLASELQLNLRPEFNNALSEKGIFGLVMRLTGIGGPRPGETEEERVLAAYYKALQVYEMKETRVIGVSFTARDSALAAKAANRLIELYQERLRQQGVSETTDNNAWLRPEIEKRTSELALAEANVEKFRSSANLFRGNSGNDVSGLAEQQLTDLTSELTKARGQRSEAEARARSGRELINRGSPDAIPDVQKSPVVQGLIAQRVRAERDIAEASSQLLPAHPRMRQLYANLADLRRQVQREAVTVVEGLEREAKVLQLREELAQRSLDDAKARIGAKAGDRIRLAQLEDEAKAKRRELAALRDRFEAARSRTTTKPTPVELAVIATARASSQPAWPNPAKTAFLAATATLLLGFASVFFRALFAGAPRLPAARAEPALAGSRTTGTAGVATAQSPRVDQGLPQAEAMPDPALMARVRSTAGGGSASKPVGGSAIASLTDIVQRLIGNSGGHGGYRTVIVGDSDNVDARQQAADIAAGLAAAGRQVVLVDWSLDGDGAAAGFGLPAAPGFSDLLAGTHEFENVVQALPSGDVHFISSGGRSVSRGVMLEPDRLNMLLDALDEAYGDVVVMGRNSDIRDLFLAVEGRFDAGIVVSEGAGAGNRGDGGGQFLGFDVTDIDVIRFVRGRTSANLRRPVHKAQGPRAASSTGVASAAS
ncbi:MAG: exopolysaccharide transport family protein [Hyphomicrobiaceae bacterium]